MLQGHHADPALVGDHQQSLVLGNDRAIGALARAHLLVAVHADDQEAAEFPGGLEVQRVALMDEVEGAAGQHDADPERLECGRDLGDPVEVGNIAQIEVRRVLEQAT
jgi:hypothetical protein